MTQFSGFVRDSCEQKFHDSLMVVLVWNSSISFTLSGARPHCFFFFTSFSDVSQCAWIQVSQVLCRAPMEKLKVKQFQICCSNYLSYIKARQAICEQIYFWLVRLRSKLSDVCLKFYSETNTVASLLIDFTWFTPWQYARTTQLCGKWLF